MAERNFSNRFFTDHFAAGLKRQLQTSRRKKFWTRGKWRVMNGKNLPQPSDTPWLKQHDRYLGDYSMCEVDGKVSLTVILPDEKKIEEKVNTFMANYGTNSFYDIQIDNYQKMNSDQALERIHAEAQKWSVGAKNKNRIPQEEESVKDWIMGHPTDGQSFFADIYCEQDKYAIASEAMHDVLDQNQFVWRYQITMAWEFDARARQFDTKKSSASNNRH